MPRYCQQCGAYVAEEAKFCPTCGASVDVVQSPATESPSSPEPVAGPDAVSSAARSAGGAAGPRYRGVLLAVILIEIVIGAGLFYGYRQYRASAGRQERLQSASTPPAVERTSVTPPTTTEPLPTETQKASETTANVEPPSPPAAATKSKKGSAVESKPAPTKPSSPTTSSATPPPPPRPVMTSEQRLKRGRDFLNAKQYSEALSEFRQVRRLDPRNRDVFYLMGLSHEQLGQLEEALEAYRECTSGPYASVAQNHVKRLAKKLRK